MSRPPITGLHDDPRGEQEELPDAVDPLDVPQSPSPRPPPTRFGASCST